MKSIDDLWQTLFPNTQAFHEEQFLRFVETRVPTDLADQLCHDSQPDLSLNNAVGVADLMRPLSTHAFPTEKLYDIADVLSFTLFVYRNLYIEKSTRVDPYKVIYVSSLYLHCFIHGHGKPIHGAFTPTLSMLASICVQMDLQTRIQVCRFLVSILPPLREENIWEDAPLSSVLIVTLLILGSSVEQLSILAEESMRSEEIEKEWAEGQGEERAPSDEAIGDLKRSVIAMFSPQGQLVQCSARLLSTLMREESNTI